MANTSQTLAERAAYDVGVAPQNVGTTDVTGDWFPMADYRRVAAVGLAEASAAADEALTVTLQQATDDSGAGAKDLGAAVTATSTGAGEDMSAVAEAQAEDMDAGFTHVAVTVGHSEAGQLGSAVLVRGDGRFR